MKRNIFTKPGQVGIRDHRKPRTTTAVKALVWTSDLDPASFGTYQMVPEEHGPVSGKITVVRLPLEDQAPSPAQVQPILP
jgi:hypothetical protein